MAFNEEAKRLVKQAIEGETKEAVAKWGKTYNSLHEGYAVLKEEVEEAAEEQKGTQYLLDYFWDCIRTLKNNKCTSTVAELKKHAEQMALEAIQIAAVCNKIMNGM